MRYPARLAHLATRAIVVAKLAPTFADAHHLDHEEAVDRLNTALSGPLLDDLLAATWQALLGGTKKLDEEGLAGEGGQEPQRPSASARPPGRGHPGPRAPSSCSRTSRQGPRATPRGRVMETDAGKARARAGLVVAGQLLARELTR